MLQTDTTSNMTRLRVENSNRNDSGKYTITAKNEYGKDSADIEVTVVNKPGQPKGPLNYDTVIQDTISLSWQPPTDDGGSDVTGNVSYLLRCINLRIYILNILWLVSNNLYSHMWLCKLLLTSQSIFSPEHL